MGVVNVTPDSFSDGGRFLDPDAAVAHGLKLASELAYLTSVTHTCMPSSEPVPVGEVAYWPSGSNGAGTHDKPWGAPRAGRGERAIPRDIAAIVR